ncbi:MAG: hypothetical protein ACPL7B_05490 [Candidatus Poribacteria bacterium]
MKKTGSIIVFVLFISGILACEVLCFQKGENQIINSTFENDKVGETPFGWVLQTGG